MGWWRLLIFHHNYSLVACHQRKKMVQIYIILTFSMNFFNQKQKKNTFAVDQGRVYPGANRVVASEPTDFVPGHLERTEWRCSGHWVDRPDRVAYFKCFFFTHSQLLNTHSQSLVHALSYSSSFFCSFSAFIFEFIVVTFGKQSVHHNVNFTPINTMFMCHVFMCAYEGTERETKFTGLEKEETKKQNIL